GLARFGHAAVDRVSLCCHCGPRGTRSLAVLRADLADPVVRAGDGHCPARRTLRVTRAADARHHRDAADVGPALAQPAVCRGCTRHSLTIYPRAWTDLPRTVAGRGRGHGAAAAPKPADRLAADCRARRIHDRALCCGLRRVPTAGSAGLNIRGFPRGKREGDGNNRPPFGFSGLAASDRQDRYDPVSAGIDNDDFLTDDEILVAPPARIDFDQSRRYRSKANRCRDDGAHAEGEVHIRDPWRITRIDDGLADLGFLLRIERHVATCCSAGISLGSARARRAGLTRSAGLT